MCYNKELVAICIDNKVSKDKIYDILGSLRSTDFLKLDGALLAEYLDGDEDCERLNNHYNIYVNDKLHIKPKLGEIEIYEDHKIDYIPNVQVKYRAKIENLDRLLLNFPMLKITKLGSFSNKKFMLEFE